MSKIYNHSPIFRETRIALKTDKKNFSIIWRTCSTTHAVIMFSLSTYYWIYVFPKYRTRDFASIHKIETYEENAFQLMIGFLWYDMIVEISQTCQIDSVIHHILCLLSLYSTLITNNHATTYYNMMLYMAEGSTPWLNISWVCFNINAVDNIICKLSSMNLRSIRVFVSIWIQKCGLPISFSCINIFIHEKRLMITFFLFRICIPTYICWNLNYYSNEWPWETKPYTHQLFVFNNFLAFFFAILNYYWFYKLVKIAFGGKTISNDNKCI